MGQQRRDSGGVSATSAMSVRGLDTLSRVSVKLRTVVK